ncbi:hypothetical protein ULMS_16310 [Patiriisocius marinistellae]|uniref:Outer membrane protein beta-barrel domain-containing protein n=2 Tax=Patiriisocius marinistellae TaxID=2494560 RepID=A0A5J4FW34_9FLAO|nr:hypothetical protein ULMS_16310 [Patiriisocius marinistellae]
MCLFSQSVIAQNLKKIDTLEVAEKKLKFGLGFGLGFVGGTNVSLSPNLTYKLSDKVNIGAGLQGSYTAIKDIQNTFTAGANVLSNYAPIEQISILIEFAELYALRKTDSPEGDIEKDFWESALFLGAGYNVTNKIAISAKFNFLYDSGGSVYTSPVIPFVNISF